MTDGTYGKITEGMLDEIGNRWAKREGEVRWYLPGVAEVVP